MNGLWIPPGSSWEDIEKLSIEWALWLTNGNRTRAADLLKISIRSIRNKINHYNLRSAK